MKRTKDELIIALDNGLIESEDLIERITISDNNIHVEGLSMDDRGNYIPFSLHIPRVKKDHITEL